MLYTLQISQVSRGHLIITVCLKQQINWPSHDESTTSYHSLHNNKLLSHCHPYTSRNIFHTEVNLHHSYYHHLQLHQILQKKKLYQVLTGLSFDALRYRIEIHHIHNTKRKIYTNQWKCKSRAQILRSEFIKGILAIQFFMSPYSFLSNHHQYYHLPLYNIRL